MITTLHVVNQRYGLLNAKLSPVQYVPGYLLEYACFCGVNCFALLTGYLSGGKTMAYNQAFFSKFFTLWIKIVLWGILIFLATHAAFPGKFALPLREIMRFFLPVYGRWWYISAYFGLMLFLPVLTAFTAGCEGKTLLIGSILLFLFCSFLPTNFYMIGNGALGLSGGYSTIWLMICFLWGATLRKYMDRLLTLKYRNILLMIGLPLSVLLPVFFHGFAKKILCCSDSYRFMDYLSPFCVMEAVFLLMCCRMISIRNVRLKKGIAFLSKNALGIYLLQCHPCIWGLIFNSQPSPSPREMIYLIPAWVLGMAVAGILANVLIDRLYHLCRFDRLVQWMISKTSKLVKI